ncbi:MAG: NUDIX domain-containing protein [Pseudomonadota bacterium]
MAKLHSHFGVYAGIMDEPGEKILLIKKARGPYTGLLDLPGGSPEDEELLEDTLIREVAEETGGTVTAMSQIGANSVLYLYGEEGDERVLRHIGVFYEAAVEGVTIGQSDGEDSLGARWWSIADLTEDKVTPFVWAASGSSEE